MSRKPVVSIVSVTYNQEKYVRQAFDSFLMQKTSFKFEIVVSDDASSDTTPDIIKEYADKYPDIFRPILRKKNVGVASNFIKTMEEAEGKYVALCEGDDFWTDPSKLQKQVDLMENNPEFALCFHPIKVFFENNEEGESAWPNVTDSSKLTLEELITENFIPTNAVMYRRIAYKNMPVNIMPIDWYLHIYHALHGGIGFINETMSSYRRHSQGVWWGSYEDTDKLWLKYGSSHIAMHLEVLKLVDDDVDRRNLALVSLGRVTAKMMTIDKKLNGHIILDVLQEYPHNTLSLIAALSSEIEIQEVEISEKNITSIKKEEELTNQLIELREQAHALKDELHTLKNSRVFGKIIRLREHVGKVRNVVIDTKNLPRKTVHKVRVVVAPFVRPATRKKIKSIYRQSKRALGGFTGVNNVVVSTIASAVWPKKIPLVSVVVPYFNASETIDETLDSLKNQTFLDLEIIIVNDGSTDELSIEKFDSLKNNNPDIKFVTQKNQGPAAARNAGVALAKGKYVICLDSDDWFESTYVEKVILILETNPDIAVVSPYTETFGVKKSLVEPLPYDPILLFSNNMLIHASAFRREAWQVSGGYKSGLGYEDWEYWITLAEKGYWGKVLEEPLFHYRVATESRYVNDKDAHWRNLKKIKALHPNYKKIVKKLHLQKRNKKTVVDPTTALVNLENINQYKALSKDRVKILITIPWMTFGGAETLIYNYCREIKNDFSITFMTGLKSKNEWEYKFREITPNIYHLANMFDDPKIYLEFISNYIKTREIDILHVIHNGFTFDFLPEIKKRNPNLKAIVTMFNDRVEYFQQSIGYEKYVDSYVTDNELVAKHYKASLDPNKSVRVIPNGINCYKEFNTEMSDGSAVRKSLELGENDLSVFYVGRLSEEKNPDVFLEAASELLKSSKNTRLKFYMIGDGPMRPAVEKQLKEIDNDSVKYLGYQSEIAKYLSAADIFVLPSSIEGFPLSILEAMAMKVAVISSDVGAVSQVITDGEDGFVVKPGSAEEITKTITMLASDSSLLQSVKQKARLKVESKYSNKILGENYKKLYTDVSK